MNTCTLQGHSAPTTEVASLEEGGNSDSNGNDGHHWGGNGTSTEQTEATGLSSSLDLSNLVCVSLNLNIVGLEALWLGGGDTVSGLVIRWYLLLHKLEGHGGVLGLGLEGVEGVLGVLVSEGLDGELDLAVSISVEATARV
eukprot:GFYU01004043.1.p1 GENE.GFYU01004043.1~~GFYU01004043.1.p1  ORF type:complete len:141 (+),score=30.65 GFYU01004043.1:3-425(+)